MDATDGKQTGDAGAVGDNKRPIDSLSADAAQEDATPDGTNNETNKSPRKFSKFIERKRKKKKEKDSYNRYKRPWNEQDSSVKLNAGSFASEAFCLKMGVPFPKEARTPSSETSQTDDNDKATESDPETKRLPKRKVAFLVGYLGTKYGGFQMTDDYITLQAQIELALAKCKMLSSANFGYPSKYKWSTSGRTDKGVHACAQVCSAKVILPTIADTDNTNATDTTSVMDVVRQQLNDVLPSDIRILDVIRTTRNFCAKTQRDRVRYQYMIPSFVLMPIQEARQSLEQVLPDILLKQDQDQNSKERSIRNPSGPLSKDEIAKLQTLLYGHRAGSEALERLRQALKRYEGTHSFHNYTKGVRADEGRASRYIIEFHADDPVVIDGMEWIPTHVVGQSFLLHQIRKMISVAVDVARSTTPVATLEKALQKDCVTRLNVAPAQGLFLEMSFYQGYNRRKQTNPDLLDINWDNPSSAAHARWKDFRNNVVMAHIVQEERQEGNFVKYLYVQEYVYDHKKYYDFDKKQETIDTQSDLPDESSSESDTGG